MNNFLVFQLLADALFNNNLLDSRDLLQLVERITCSTESFDLNHTNQEVWRLWWAYGHTDTYFGCGFQESFLFPIGAQSKWKETNFYSTKCIQVSYLPKLFGVATPKIHVLRGKKDYNSSLVPMESCKLFLSWSMFGTKPKSNVI